jgi:spermidine/putrescine-binding protein
MNNFWPDDAVWVRHVYRRAIIVLVYLALLFGFLYLPTVFRSLSNQKTLNIYAFTETFSPEAIERFEDKFGVKVNMTYAELDEEIGAKFSINSGDGYDVVNVSDFMVKQLVAGGYLQVLDHEKIPAMEHLNQRLMGHVFDPKNQHSIPHKWFMYGLVYDKNFFSQTPNEMSLAFVFTDPAKLFALGLVKKPYRICMIDSPMDDYFLSMRYLYGRHDAFCEEDFAAITKALLQQKQWVECYTLYSVEYFLLSGLVPIALTSSNFVRKIWSMSDKYEFAIPKEGGILVIENLVVPKKSKKTVLAHQFIDFMLSDEIARVNSEEYGWTSANIVVQKDLDADCDPASHLLPDEQLFTRLHIPLFTPYARKHADDAWLRVGFA